MKKEATTGSLALCNVDARQRFRRMRLVGVGGPKFSGKKVGTRDNDADISVPQHLRQTSVRLESSSTPRWHDLFFAFASSIWRRHLSRAKSRVSSDPVGAIN